MQGQDQQRNKKDGRPTVVVTAPKKAALLYKPKLYNIVRVKDGKKDERLSSGESSSSSDSSQSTTAVVHNVGNRRVSGRVSYVKYPAQKCIIVSKNKFSDGGFKFIKRPRKEPIGVSSIVSGDRSQIKSVITFLEGSNERIISDCTAILRVIVSRNVEVLLERVPLEHYARLQLGLTAQNWHTGIQRANICYLDFREGLENLFCLALILKQQKRDLVTASILAKELVALITTCEELAAAAETFSKVRVTNWLNVRRLAEAKVEKLTRLAGKQDRARFKDLKLGKLLGAGGFGAVHKAFIGTAEVTVKWVPVAQLSEPRFACIDKMYAVMNTNPFLVKYHCCFSTPLFFVTVMEYITGVDAQKVLTKHGAFTEEITRVIIAQLGLALQHIHRQGLIHRDVKPANIMLSPTFRIKLLDLDIAKVCIGRFTEKELLTWNSRTHEEFSDDDVCGTVHYFAPELLIWAPYATYGRSIDWYATGILAYVLALDAVPYHGATDAEIHKQILEGNLRWPQGCRISSAIMDFVTQCVRLKAVDRLCSSHYDEFQCHPWFDGLDWEWIANCTDYFPKNNIVISCMSFNVDHFSPVVSPNAEQKKRMLVQSDKDLTQDDNYKQENLYVFTSEAFRRALEKLDRGETPTNKDLEEWDKYIPVGPKTGEYMFETL